MTDQEYIRVLEEALCRLLAADGTIIPIYNEEFLQASWVRHVARQALKVRNEE